MKGAEFLSMCIKLVFLLQWYCFWWNGNFLWYLLIHMISATLSVLWASAYQYYWCWLIADSDMIHSLCYFALYIAHKTFLSAYCRLFWKASRGLSSWNETTPNSTSWKYESDWQENCRDFTRLWLVDNFCNLLYSGYLHIYMHMFMTLIVDENILAFHIFDSTV